MEFIRVVRDREREPFDRDLLDFERLRVGPCCPCCDFPWPVDRARDRVRLLRACLETERFPEAPASDSVGGVIVRRRAACPLANPSMEGSDSDEESMRM